MRLRCMVCFFSPWGHSASLLLILGDFIFPESVQALLEERSVIVRLVLPGIDFSTEESPCLDFILVQLFPLFGNGCDFSVIWCVQEH